MNAWPARGVRTAPSVVGWPSGPRPGSPRLLRLGLDAYDRMIGLNLDDLAVDGAITKSPCGGEVSGRSPVDRGKQGTKRSVACDGDGIPLHLVAARANDHDSPLLQPTLAGICNMIGPLPNQPCMHLDHGYDSNKTRDLLEILGYHAEIAAKGTPAPIQAGKRWPVERCHSWMNGYGKLRRNTDKRKIIVEFYHYLTAALTVIRRLINRARTHYAGQPDPPLDSSADDHLPVALKSLNRSDPRPVSLCKPVTRPNLRGLELVTEYFKHL